MLNIATGYLYGFWDGLCITIIGAAVGGFVSFLACRQLAKGYVTSLLSSYENLKQIIRVLDGARIRSVMAPKLLLREDDVADGAGLVCGLERKCVQCSQRLVNVLERQLGWVVR